MEKSMLFSEVNFPGFKGVWLQSTAAAPPPPPPPPPLNIEK
jgi:hypothetical protein